MSSTCPGVFSCHLDVSLLSRASNTEWGSWSASIWTAISLITSSHLLLPRKVILLLGAGTADVSTACSIGHFVSGRIEGSIQTIIWLSVISSLCSWKLILAQTLTGLQNYIKNIFLRQTFMSPLGLRIELQGRDEPFTGNSRFSERAHRYSGKQTSIKAINHEIRCASLI